MYPKGDPSTTGFMSVDLVKVSSGTDKAKSVFSILDKDKNTYSEIGYDADFDLYQDNTNWGHGQFIDLDSLKEQSSQLLPNDSLTIVCDITVLEPEETVMESKHMDIERQKASRDQVCRDLEFALENKEFSDVQIHCGGQVFDCHQVILSARSPVFRTMFQADMAEKKTRKVNIVDIDPNIMEDLLSFIYAGKTPKLDEHATDILAAAEKYQLDGLKELCEENLCRNLGHENCINHLILGDMYQANKLKKASLQFIAKNVNVFLSKDWETCLRDRQNLMVDVIKAMARKDSE